MTTLRTRLRGLLATLALLAIVAGLPLVLLAVGASPIPASMPSLETITSALSSQDDGTLVLAFIKVVAWAAWAFLSLSIAGELISRVRGIRAPHMPGLRLPQSAARALVSTAMLLFIAAPMSVQGAPVAAAASVPAAVAPAVLATPSPAGGHNQTISTSTTGHSTPAPAAARSTPKAETPPATITHTVKRGETLWSIATDHLGAGDKYPEIAALNADVLGRRPGFLKPGWVLNLPTRDQHGQSGEHTVTVHRGDTLSGIAQEELGDPSRYPEIFEASKATTQPGGAHLADPNLIGVGWSLTIPAGTTPTESSDPKPGKTVPPPGPEWISRPAPGQIKTSPGRARARHDPTGTGDPHAGAGRERAGKPVRQPAPEPRGSHLGRGQAQRALDA